jgi:ABC-type transport system substrate-binding protein
MHSHNRGINRREFLKNSTLADLGVFVGGASWHGSSHAASRERLTILSSISLSSLHPYASSSSPEYGIWNHIAEPLVEVDYVKMDYVGVLGESWQFQGKQWIFNLKKGPAFTMAPCLPPRM